MSAIQQILCGYGGTAEVCSPSQGNLLNDEGFETAITGYQQSGWGTATGTPSPAYSITGLTTSKPSGSCAQGFRANYAITSLYQFNAWDSGGNNSSTVYVRFYYYLVSHSIASGETAIIAGVFNGTTVNSGTRCAGVTIKNNAGQMEIYAEGSTHTNISTGQWYRVELQVALNASAAGSAIKIDGGSALTFTDTGYSSWRKVGIGTISTSSDAFTFNDSVFDLVAADSTGYIGPTP